MKLLIVLTVIACGYAAKLDRTYLPPANAGASGGSSGSLNTPLGPSGFGQPASFGQTETNGGFNGAAGRTSGAFGGQSGHNGLGTHSNQYGQPENSRSGQTVEANYDSGFGGPVQSFKNSQDYQRSQPQRPQASAEQSAEILRSDSQNDGETFSYSFETSNGISAEESGVATNGVQAQGAFAYSSDDGQMFRVQYTADENGYQPQGDHLPTSPPIPDEILKSIEQNARAAASGTQEGAYNPNEEENEVSYQQYKTNTPTSYNQATGQNGFSQAGKSSAQLYGAPSSGSRPQGPQSFSQSPSQQYNADFGASNSGPTGPSNVIGQPKVKSPSQLYGSPSNDAARPSSFGQQGPSQQYSARPSGTSSFSQSASQQYQASQSSQFPSAGRPQGPAQAQDASGYQYNKPQGGFGGNNNNEPNQQYRPQNRAPSGPQGFSRPSSNSFPSLGSSVQGSFGASPNSQGSFASSGTKSPSSFGSTSQTSYGSFAMPNSQSSFASSGSGTSSFGSNSQGLAARPNSGFSPSTGSQQSFGSSSKGFDRPQALGSDAQGFSRPQGQVPGAKSPMPGSGYEYNRPSGNSQFSGSRSQNGNAPFGGSSQNGFKSAGQGRPGQFGAPRAPPSFSEEEGYKY